MGLKRIISFAIILSFYFIMFSYFSNLKLKTYSNDKTFPVTSGQGELNRSTNYKTLIKVKVSSIFSERFQKDQIAQFYGVTEFTDLYNYNWHDLLQLRIEVHFVFFTF